MDKTAYKIILCSGTIVSICGYTVNNPVFPKFPLIVGKYQKRWALSDHRSGIKIGPLCTTRKEAITNGFTRLNEQIALKGRKNVFSLFNTANALN